MLFVNARIIANFNEKFAGFPKASYRADGEVNRFDITIVWREIMSELQVFIALPICLDVNICFKSNGKLDNLDRSRSNGEKQIGVQLVPCQNAR